MPATTRSPTARAAGRDSPVIIDSSSSAAPSTMTPSAGTRPPERTRTTSPTASSLAGTVRTPPPVTTSASSGRSDARASRAPLACPIARISSQWPSSITAISAASSHQKSRSTSPNSVAQLAANATEIASPINSIMPGCRDRTSETAPVRKGHPP